jgi:hypothetical protein
MSPNAGGEGWSCGVSAQLMSTAEHRSPNKLWRSNSTLWTYLFVRSALLVLYERGFVDANLSAKRRLFHSVTAPEEAIHLYQRIKGVPGLC